MIGRVLSGGIIFQPACGKIVERFIFSMENWHVSTTRRSRVVIIGP